MCEIGAYSKARKVHLVELDDSIVASCYCPLGLAPRLPVQGECISPHSLLNFELNRYVQ
jgi:hypothetical protein